MKVEVLKRLMSVSKREYLKYALLLVVLMIPSIDFLFHILVLYFFGSLLYLRYDYDKSWKFILKAPILSIAFIRLVMYSFPYNDYYNYGKILGFWFYIVGFIFYFFYLISKYDLGESLCDYYCVERLFSQDVSCDEYLARFFYLCFLLLFICIFLLLWLKHKSIKYLFFNHAWVLYLAIPSIIFVIGYFFDFIGLIKF